jgi:hypothetical protein
VVVKKNFAGRGPDPRAPPRGQDARPGDQRQHGRLPPVVSKRRPEFVQNVLGEDDGAGRRATICRSARCPRRHVSGGHDEVREAQHLRSHPGLGVPTCASSAASARWSARTRSSAPSVYDPNRSLAGAPSGFKSARSAARRSPGGQQVHAAGRSRGLHGLRRSAWTSARPRARSRSAVKAINMQDKTPHPEQERANLGSSTTCRRSTRHEGLDLTAAGEGPPSVPEPLFEFSGACSGCGETPYVKMADASCSATAPGRQRHGLLVDLRRQPADDALGEEQARPRPRVVQLAVRGQRGVRLRLRLCARQAARATRANSCSARGRLARRWSRSCSSTPQK